MHERKGKKSVHAWSGEGSQCLRQEPTTGFQKQEAQSAKERTGNAEGRSVLSDLCACA